jgi:hypothetical protein
MALHTCLHAPGSYSCLPLFPFSGQWLNYPPPGTPLKDGKPDLTGVWMHESTGLAEMRRLFGDLADAESGPIGMEI